MHDELIARLEAATGPDRELDLVIWKFLAPEGEKSYRSIVSQNWDAFVPAFTASIDAALTLVPEGWLWRIMPSDFNGWLAEVWTDDTLDGEFGARAPTPALAIVIAALRAKGGE